MGPLQIYYIKIKILLARFFAYNGVLKSKIMKFNVDFDFRSEKPKEKPIEIMSNYVKKLS